MQESYEIVQSRIPYCAKTSAAPINAETAQTTRLARTPDPTAKVDVPAPFDGLGD